MLPKLLANGIKMSKLLKHAEVVAHCKVLDNLPLFQAETMDVLDLEFLAIGSQGWPTQRGDLGQVAEVRARQSDLAHHCVAFLDEQLYFKKQIRESAAPCANDVLNAPSNVRILDTEIGEPRGKELVYLFDLSVIPKFLKVALNAVLVGAFSHKDPRINLRSIHPFTVEGVGKNSHLCRQRVSHFPLSRTSQTR